MDIDYMINEGIHKKDILIELRTQTGMNWKELAGYLKIPYRTMQDWQRGEREMPDYVLRFMAYQLKVEGLIK